MNHPLEVWFLSAADRHTKDVTCGGVCQDETVRCVGDQDREIRLTSQIVAEYMVSRGRLLLVMLRIFDDADILLPED